MHLRLQRPQALQNTDLLGRFDKALLDGDNCLRLGDIALFFDFSERFSANARVRNQLVTAYTKFSPSPSQGLSVHRSSVRSGNKRYRAAPLNS